MVCPIVTKVLLNFSLLQDLSQEMDTGMENLVMLLRAEYNTGNKTALTSEIAWNCLLVSEFHKSQQMKQYHTDLLFILPLIFRSHLVSLLQNVGTYSTPTVPPSAVASTNLSLDEVEQILLGLHLVYEDCKLSVLKICYLYNLAKLLIKIGMLYPSLALLT